MRSHPPRAKQARLPAVVLAFAVVVLLLNVPAPARATPSLQTMGVQPNVSSSPFYVTWNGVDVSTAGTSSSALAIDLSQSANLNFNWSTGTSARLSVTDARLEMFYFGFAVTTRDQIVSGAIASAKGNIPLSWTPLSISFVLEGVYRLTATFLDNGTTLWSENFYVRGTAPLGFVALLPIALLLIIAYELYGLVRSGRYAMLGRKSGGPPPSMPPAGTPPADTTAPAATPAENSPPPSGGGS